MITIKNEQEREALRKYIDDNILTSKESLEILGFSKERLNQLVQEDRIIPIRKGLGIYLKDDKMAFKENRR